MTSRQEFQGRTSKRPEQLQQSLIMSSTPDRLTDAEWNAVVPYTTAHIRFNRWRKNGTWNRLMDAVAAAHDGDVRR